MRKTVWQVFMLVDKLK